MVSRANKEQRDNTIAAASPPKKAAATNPEAPAYGAPMGPPPVVSEQEKLKRDRERKAKLESKATPEERETLIEEHKERAIEESEKLAQERKDKKTAAPKLPPYTRVGETTGKSPTQIIAERPEDVGKAIDIAEGVEPLEEEEVEVEEPTETFSPRKIRPPKRK